MRDPTNAEPIALGAASRAGRNTKSSSNVPLCNPTCERNKVALRASCQFYAHWDRLFCASL